jgi:hypothetical protein
MATRIFKGLAIEQAGVDFKVRMLYITWILCCEALLPIFLAE